MTEAHSESRFNRNRWSVSGPMSAEDFVRNVAACANKRADEAVARARAERQRQAVQQDEGRAAR